MNRMTCREFDEVVHGLVRMELLDVALHEAALDHSARCSNCAERMNEARLLAEATEEAANSGRLQQSRANMKDVLLVAFRSWHRRKVLWRTLEWAMAGAAVAVLSVFLWTSSGRTKIPSTPVPGKNVSSQSNAPLEVTGPIASQPGKLEADADVQIDNAAVDGTSQDDDFVPVPYGAEIDPQDSGMIVRVQLTRASLAELGYPVVKSPEEDLIQADILVGEDGWPRGVRLVQ